MLWVTLLLLLTSVVAVIPQAPAPPVDEKCDNVTCTMVRLDDNVDPDNVLDTTTGGRATPQTLFWGNQKVWTNGTDGVGSTLDADLLDGLNGTQFLRSDQSGTLTGTLTLTGDLSLGGSMTAGTVPWARLDSFPSACASGQFVTAVGSTLTCATPAPATAGGWTDDGTTVRLTTTSDSVGIGTDSPGQKLTVAGTIESTSGGFKFPDGTTMGTASPRWQSLGSTTISGTSPVAINMPAGCATAICTIAMIKRDTDGLASSQAVRTEYKQEGDNEWLTLGLDNTAGGRQGTNGDAAASNVLTENSLDCILRDDLSGTETSSTQWAVVDGSATDACEVWAFA